MKNYLTRLFCIALFFSVYTVAAQDLTGVWRGYFYTESGDQYKYELQINHKRTGLTGVSYSYLDTRFYGKAELAGKFVASGNALVQELKTVEVRMAGSSVACVMRCVMSYSRSGREEFLEGEFTSKYETSNPIYGIQKGGNCGGGKVFLRKVPTSDFYLEPFLDKPPPVRSKPAPQTKPRESKPSAPQEEAPKVERPKVDSIARKNIETPVFDNKTINQKINPTPVITRERKNELLRTLVVNNEEIEIRLYDNGEIDDDTISVYLNDRLILSNKRLSEKPIIYKLTLTEDEPEHTLVMVAENLGRIPPNTSLMIVQDGDKRYQVSITSTEQKNAMVRFRYEKKE